MPKGTIPCAIRKGALTNYENFHGQNCTPHLEA